MDNRVELGPAAARLAALVQGVRDEQLAGKTPCEEYSVEVLLQHIDGLSQAFTAAAQKNLGPLTAAPTGSKPPALEAGWRLRIQAQLEAMARAWESPEAWEGMTQAGGIDLPGSVAGLVAADELAIHGWDLARATGQPFEVDAGALGAATWFVEEMSQPGQSREGLFGPALPVPEGATDLERVIALSGRDPRWTAAS
ncbi:TIGR03086 family protein [Arthrobacter sp. JZ12]|uniref:TIGR03086 family metal-binding protein n=1 Tax=Arthrobacter sp. JZ12 TaxID=2654190 RepID=UPI002B49C8EF|nr:TIGR03086 family metal-binding protein [Arthrobacter sp. JZ12]WRH25655.1 TIGR03086 family protein [Arthrobacter sp. JZ12]